MKKISLFADGRPLSFSLLALLGWISLGGITLMGETLLLKLPVNNPFVQIASTLTATVLFLGLITRLGWLRAIGITRLGTFSTWVITALLGVYIVRVGFYAFFKEIGFGPITLTLTAESRAILLHDLLVGFVEETMFRGILLYALVRVWGQTKKGQAAAILVQAGLFGVLHTLQVLAGVAPAAATANVFATFVFGVWAGALVLSVKSLWPAIFLHTISNACILIKGLSSAWVDPISTGYLVEALLETPIAILAVWAILKTRSVDRLAYHHTPETNPGT